MRTAEDLPTRQSMKSGHTVRKFRRGNHAKDRQYLARKAKPWRTPIENGAAA